MSKTEIFFTKIHKCFLPYLNNQILAASKHVYTSIQPAHGPSILIVLIRVQTVCKGYQQMTEVDTSKQRVKNTIPCTASPSHEFIIIAFYDEGAGLVAVQWVVRNIIYLKFQNQFNLLF